MNVRLLARADAAAFKALRLRGLIEIPTAFSASVEEEETVPLETVAEQVAPTAHRAVVGLFDGESLVGIAGVFREQTRKLAHKATIWGVYVAPEARRGGAGRQLLQAAMAHAYAMDGVRQIYLSVQDINLPARRLYESLGFEAIGVERDFMIVDGVPQDELHMAHYRAPRGMTKDEGRISNFEC